MQGLAFRRTHDLFELAHRLQAAGVALPCPVETLGKLNPYAVLFRYDSSQDIDLMPLSQAEAIAADVLRWAEVVLSDRCLDAAKPGAPLSEKGLIALLQSHSSPKRDNRMGRFGLGFKSLLSLGGSLDIFSLSLTGWTS